MKLPYEEHKALRKQKNRDATRKRRKTPRSRELARRRTCSLCHQSRKDMIDGLKNSPGSPAFNAAKETVLACSECRGSLYKRFRGLTGHCELCQCRMDTHPTCFYCDILLGQGHESTVYKESPTGRLWCGHCMPIEKG